MTAAVGEALPGALAGSLREALLATCDDLAQRCSPETAAGVRHVAARLGSPLQVAVAGRISSGKSTLVNALIGRRVAPTAVGECTRLVTRFSYGDVDRVEVITHAGARTVVPLTAEGMIPADVATLAGVRPEEVSHLEAYLTSALLAELTVVDTPGLGSLDTASSARTDAHLVGSTRSAVAGAEAVLYVFTQTVRADDAEALAAFAGATAGQDAGPVNALGLLNKADTVAPESVAEAGGNVSQAARLLAGAQQRLLGSRVAEVLPVIGLLGETCETGGLGTREVDALRVLAAVPDDTRIAMLLATDLFLSLDCPLDVPTRRHLLEVLDLYGVACAVRALRADPHMSVGRLRSALNAVSGLAQVRERLAVVFSARAEGIKASAALASLSALARSCARPDDQQLLRSAVELLLRRPETHQLRLVEAQTLLRTGAVMLPPPLVGEALRLRPGTDPAHQLGRPGATRAELAGHALQRAGWWRSFAGFAETSEQAQVGHVVHRAYFLLWQELQDAAR